MKFGDTIIKIFAQIFFQIKFILIMLQKYIIFNFGDNDGF